MVDNISEIGWKDGIRMKDNVLVKVCLTSLLEILYDAKRFIEGNNRKK
jgi:hypothetical protein